MFFAICFPEGLTNVNRPKPFGSTPDRLSVTPSVSVTVWGPPETLTEEGLKVMLVMLGGAVSGVDSTVRLVENPIDWRSDVEK